LEILRKELKKSIKIKKQRLKSKSKELVGIERNIIYEELHSFLHFYLVILDFVKTHLIAKSITSGLLIFIVLFIFLR
jgi:hypothetical protein